MVGAIIDIILGYIVLRYIPKWITLSSTKANEILRVCAIVIGLIMILSGIASLLKTVLGIF